MNPIVPQKRCTKCGVEYPATTEFFHKAECGKYGLRSRCRVCYAAMIKTYSEAHKPQAKARSSKWYAENKERANESRRKRLSDPTNSQVHKAKQKQLRETPESKEYQRQYRRSPQHKEKEKERNRKRWGNRDYREKKKISGHNYRATKRKLPREFTSEQWKRCLEYWQYRCAVCGNIAGLWHTLAPDHWIALKNGGPTTVDNIVPLCHSRKDGHNCCNNSKQDTEAEIWLVNRYSKRKAKQILDRINAYFEWVKQQ
jgi:hypothetical protein